MATSANKLDQFGKVHLWVGLLILICSLMGAPSTAYAHATLLSTTPEDGSRFDSAPSEIVLTFSEPVGIVEDGSSLHAGDDNVTPLTPRTSGSEVIIPLEGELGDGAYVVQWRVISADSHPISGTVSFTVGDAAIGDVSVDQLPGWASSAQTLAVFAKYLGLLAAVGVLFVGRFIVPGDISQLLRFAWGFSILALVGIVAELPFAAMNQLGSVPNDVGATMDSILSLDSATKLAGVAGLILVGLGIVVADVARKHRAAWTITSALLAGAVLSQLLSGHTRTKEPVWVMLPADAIHLIAASVWLGGIVLLAFGLSGRWWGSGFENSNQRVQAVSRFSTLAGYTAALVTISGVTMAITILRTWNALFDTIYGTTLLIKVGIVVLVIVLAAANRFILIPRLPRDETRAMTWLKRIVITELVLLVAVAGFTARLVHQDPNVYAEQPVTNVIYEGDSALDDDHTLRMRVVQIDDGEVEIHATILDINGESVVTVNDLQVDWYHPEQNLGPISLSPGYDSASGEYRGSIQIPIVGEWEVTVRAEIDRFTDSRTTVEITIAD